MASDSTVATSVHSPQDPWATNSAGGGVVSVSSKPRKGPAAATKKKTAGFMPFPKESFPAAPDQHALPPVFRNAAGRDMVSKKTFMSDTRIRSTRGKSTISPLFQPDRRPSAVIKHCSYLNYLSNIPLAPHSILQLRLVALDSPMSGSLHGALGVDYQCYREASQNGVAGSFRGFIAPPKDKASQGGHNLESIVRYQDRDLPVVNSKVRTRTRTRTNYNTREAHIDTGATSISISIDVHECEYFSGLKKAGSCVLIRNQSSFTTSPLQGQLLFSTWKSIFENRGEIHKKTATKYGIYSFSGRNVLTDRNW